MYRVRGHRKGIVFTEFMEMVEDKFAPETLEQIIDQAGLPNDGAYTCRHLRPPGVSSPNESVRLMLGLSQETKMPVARLVREFGRHLFGRFATLYALFFEGVNTAFAFLEAVDSHIHVKVRKLYPDAELPQFESEKLGPEKLSLVYRSTRALADLAEGLILGCIEHFRENIALAREDLSGGNGTCVRFVLTRSGG